MIWRLAILIALMTVLAGCASRDGGETLASLRDVKIEIEEAQIEGGLEKAIESYRQFLSATPETAMTPDAIRRLADLKVEKEYGLIAGAPATPARPQEPLAPPVASVPVAAATATSLDPVAAGEQESEEDFESRATATQPAAIATADESEDEQRANALEAIELYKKLLAEYPLYERNDQVLYQMARAYEELGEVEEAMQVMNHIVATYPQSYYLDEVQFRRGEYFFTRKKYLDAEDAYKAIANIGEGSSFYELALYKLGWSLYKQELYEEGLHHFIALLDHKVAAGADFSQIDDDIERQRIDDTFRVISFSFSYMGGPESVDDYFARFGSRAYVENVYSNLGEFYLEKRRYSDAALAYTSFVNLYPFHRASPRFDMRVIDIYKEGGFPKLVIDSNKGFARKYGLKSEYWQHFEVESYPEVLGYLKQTLKELANHYHALYQEKRFEHAKHENFNEALVWYREYLTSFPQDADSPPINYQLADLLLENRNFADAAREYEHTAYAYGAHEQASAAGYAAVYAYRQHFSTLAGIEAERTQREIVRVSLRFGDTFPTHEKAAIVLGGAADDLYEMKDYPQAASTGRRVIENYPAAEPAILRSAWLVVAHASFDLEQFVEAEEGYTQVLQRTGLEDKSRDPLYENLAASIYKQGEQATQADDHATAARHYLRIAQHAPNSTIRPTAEFDGAVALIQLKDWDGAAAVLRGFRSNFPEHELQPEVTKRIAFVYREAGNLAMAAAEYERIETESTDEEVRRGALLIAADLYEQGKLPDRAIQVYLRYLGYFPRPVEPAVEARQSLANVYKTLGDQANYHKQLKQIVAADAAAGAERTDRTRYLAATAALVITEPLYQQLVDIKLVQPFERNLQRKQAAMKAALDGFGKLASYEVGESTAAAAFYIAEIYYHFSKALMESERPDNLTALELEEYELLIEEQAYPFEEQAIEVHSKNLELISIGIYNDWVDRSLSKLAVLMPARYARAEESSGFIQSTELYQYDFVRKQPDEEDVEPMPSATEAAVAESGEPAPVADEDEHTDTDIQPVGQPEVVVRDADGTGAAAVGEGE